MADLDKNVVAIVGPTASGKTRMSIEIAKRLDGEIISFDSMQIYKGMDIASAKPTQNELVQARHHLVSFVDDGVNYSVADYCADAKKAVEDVLSRGKLPVMVGGTGLYVDSFLGNVNFAEQETDVKLREKLNATPVDELMQQLSEIDSQYAQKLNLNDKKRIIRGIEVYLNTGKTMTQTVLESKQIPSPYNAIYIGINYKDRDILYDRINKRVDIMLQNGLLEEARQVYEKGLSSTANQAIGHKELFKYFSGEESLEKCVENLKQSTRRYAKRQISWFNRNKEIEWMYADTTDFDTMVETAVGFINSKRRK